MIKVLSTIIFVICIALSAGGILIAAQLRNRYRKDFLNSLLFFEVFYLTFGCYAIWGHVIAGMILTELEAPLMYSLVSDVILLLGLPFMLFATLMFLRFCFELSGKEIPGLFSLLYIIINLAAIAAIGFFFMKRGHPNSFILMRYYFIMLAVFSTIAGTIRLLLAVQRTRHLSQRDTSRLMIVYLLVFTLQIVLSLLYPFGVYFGLGFILLFFLTGLCIPVFLRYFAHLSQTEKGTREIENLEEYCRKYGITKRESEIIAEICLGLTNQEIADKLFISLQTVKDHTSRIYLKTACQNRMQLIRQVSEL